MPAALDLSRTSLVGLSMMPATIHHLRIAPPRRTHSMDLLLTTTLLVTGLAAFAAAALRWGVDSRDSLADDRRR